LEPYLPSQINSTILTLVVESDTQIIRAIRFTDLRIIQSAWHTADFDARALFFAWALGGGLDLRLNHPLWVAARSVAARYPDHQVLILTDGAGSLPAYIPDSCRARTSALLIGLENYSDEQREDIRSIAEAIAGKVVEVPSLDDLAGVWATLIPRRQVA
jgi:hypothetical protein